MRLLAFTASGQLPHAPRQAPHPRLHSPELNFVDPHAVSPHVLNPHVPRARLLLPHALLPHVAYPRATFLRWSYLYAQIVHLLHHFPVYPHVRDHLAGHPHLLYLQQTPHNHPHLIPTYPPHYTPARNHIRHLRAFLLATTYPPCVGYPQFAARLPPAASPLRSARETLVAQLPRAAFPARAMLPTGVATLPRARYLPVAA